MHTRSTVATQPKTSLLLLDSRTPGLFIFRWMIKPISSAESGEQLNFYYKPQKPQKRVLLVISMLCKYSCIMIPFCSRTTLSKPHTFPFNCTSRVNPCGNLH